MKRLWRLLAVLLLTSACVNADNDGAIGDGGNDEDPGDCTAIDAAVSSEKIAATPREMRRSCSSWLRFGHGACDCQAVRLAARLMRRLSAARPAHGP